MLAHLLPPTYKDEVREWLRSDCPSTDVGGFVVGEKEEVATLCCKSSGVLAGIPFADAVFEMLGLKCEWLFQEGVWIDGGYTTSTKVVVALVKGKCRSILLAERTALNIISRASGVATAARKSVQIKKECGWQGFVSGTRKTTPGFKNVEKYGLLVGGVATHRLDLSQMVMLKDNHIVSAGNITNAVNLAKVAAGFSIKIEVECQSLEEALEAAQAGADIVMLDNFNPEQVNDAGSKIKEAYPKILIEASGGISESTLGNFMLPVVDIISMGSLTQGYHCLDFSLKISQTKECPEAGSTSSKNEK